MTVTQRHFLLCCLSVHLCTRVCVFMAMAGGIKQRLWHLLGWCFAVSAEYLRWGPSGSSSTFTQSSGSPWRGTRSGCLTQICFRLSAFCCCLCVHACVCVFRIFLLWQTNGVGGGAELPLGCCQLTLSWRDHGALLCFVCTSITLLLSLALWLLAHMNAPSSPQKERKKGWFDDRSCKFNICLWQDLY